MVVFEGDKFAYVGGGGDGNFDAVAFYISSEDELFIGKMADVFIF